MRIQSDGHQACLQGIFRTSSSVCLELSSVFLMSSFFKYSLFYREVSGKCRTGASPSALTGLGRCRMRMEADVSIGEAGGCRLKGAGAFRRHRACYRPPAISFWTALAASSAASCSATPCSILERLADLASW